MNEIQIFKNEMFGEVRVAGTKEEPLFCLVDLCRILELTPSKVSQRLEDGVLSKYPIVDNIGREQLANFVTEDGLYDVILDSRKPEAKQFRKWVTSEVLPSIRKNGGYMVSQPEETPEEIMARALLLAQRTIEAQKVRADYETARADALEKQTTKLNVQIEERDKQRTKDLPKITFAHAVETSDKAVLVGELAKIICQNGVNIGQNRLFHWLRENGYLGYKGEYYNLPTQKSMNAGLMEVKKTSIIKPDGTTLVTTTPKITGKGQIFFTNKFLTNK
ncbi:MAG: phage antirepressor KilAC domain-containing protein [Bacteroidales bacterium]|jgi:prophage antirepressor-like protein|nr:phage antirepressor KilAC domain-containing protein [Bacteroidales bacterium]